VTSIINIGSTQADFASEHHYLPLSQTTTTTTSAQQANYDYHSYYFTCFSKGCPGGYNVPSTSRISTFLGLLVAVATEPPLRGA